MQTILTLPRDVDQLPDWCKQAIVHAETRKVDIHAKVDKVSLQGNTFLLHFQSDNGCFVHCCRRFQNETRWADLKPPIDSQLDAILESWSSAAHNDLLADELEEIVRDL